MNINEVSPENQLPILENLLNQLSREDARALYEVAKWLATEYKSNETISKETILSWFFSVKNKQKCNYPNNNVFRISRKKLHT